MPNPIRPRGNQLTKIRPQVLQAIRNFQQSRGFGMDLVPTTGPILYSIAGTVYDTDGSTTVSGAAVALGAFNATSAANGTFTIGNIPAGTSGSMTCTKSGYIWSSISIAAMSGNLTGQNFTAVLNLSNLTFYGEVSALTGLNDGDVCGSFTDLSVNANHLTGTTTARPTYKTGIQNGLPVLRFNGSSNVLRKAFTLPQPVTVVIGYIPRAWRQSDCVFTGGDTNRMNLVMYKGSPTVSPIVTIYAGAFMPAAGFTGPTDNTPAIMTCVFNGASSSIQMNAGAATTGNAGGNTPAGFSIGGNYWVDQAFSTIDVFAAYLKAGTLTAGELSAMISYINGKWAVF